MVIGGGLKLACSVVGVWVYAARVLILTRLWAKTPCPHHVRAPLRPVRWVRFQP